MKIIKGISSLAATAIFFMFLITPAFAATSPGLGMANSFAILGSTYTNTVGGTTINGDLGYTTPPAMAPTVNGNTHIADGTYTQAGIDQGVALSALNSQPCSFTFAPGAIDLASDTTHGPIGVYTPGVYCVVGAASVGGGGTITLNGAGTYIFRMTGALNTSVGSSVVLSNGAVACNVWWTPGAATTLGANSAFVGTDIDASGITIGSTVNWHGKALAFGGIVSTDTDTINTTLCSATHPIVTPPTTTHPAATRTTIGFPKTDIVAVTNSQEQDSMLWIILAALIGTVVVCLVLIRCLISYKALT